MMGLPACQRLPGQQEAELGLSPGHVLLAGLLHARVSAQPPKGALFIPQRNSSVCIYIQPWPQPRPPPLPAAPTAAAEQVRAHYLTFLKRRMCVSG